MGSFEGKNIYKFRTNVMLSTKLTNFLNPDEFANWVLNKNWMEQKPKKDKHGTILLKTNMYVYKRN